LDCDCPRYRHHGHFADYGRQRWIARKRKRRGEIIDEVLHEGAAQPLDQAADRLAVQCQRVNDAADILDDETVGQFDVARPLRFTILPARSIHSRVRRALRPKTETEISGAGAAV
jgi:hypothetical protein